MEVENKLQAIATDSATTVAQDFLSTLPPEASQALSSSFLSTLSQDVQAELQAVIHSRLLWSLQAARAEQQRQEQHRKAVPSPAMTPTFEPALLPQAELREDACPLMGASGESEPVIEPQPLAVPALQPRRKHVLVPRSAPRKQVEAPSTPSPTLLGPNDVPPSQLELPVTAEVESLKPDQRRRGKASQLTTEETLNTYNTPPSDRASRPAEAGRRRRRTSIAMS